MSATASIVITVVIVARLLLKKAPKIFSYALWAVVLFRLLCPISLESGFSIIPSLPEEEQSQIDAESVNWNNIASTIDKIPKKQYTHYNRN